MLLLDAGNSRCKWAWVENGIWLQQGAVVNGDTQALQNLHATLGAFAAPQKILLSNVAGAAMEQTMRQLCARWDVPVQVVVAQAEQCGVYNAYEQPAQLGSDRWAALIAAWQHTRQASLVVNCGTATTVDALSERGEFLGGLILPGMELMMRSLLQNAAQLKFASGELRNFPRNTGDAIISGAIRAASGAINYQYQLLAAQSPVRCIVSGGAANALLPYLAFEAEKMDNLVLQGLQLIGQDC